MTQSLGVPDWVFQLEPLTCALPIFFRGMSLVRDARYGIELGIALGCLGRRAFMFFQLWSLSDTDTECSMSALCTHHVRKNSAACSHNF